MGSGYGKKVYSEIHESWIEPHVKAWEDFMQTPVPEDCCIHHFDGNKQNNEITNLACMTKSEHMRWHASPRSDETIKKLREKREGRRPRLGQTCSDDHKKKISETMTRIWAERKAQIKE